MRIHQLRYVVAVADRGGFSRAADALYVSQPTLSEGIARLEQRLDVRLFRRSVRPVEPTDAGRAVVTQARRALRGIERVEEVVADVAELRTGTLRIAAPGLVAASALARSISDFSSRHPGIRIHVDAPEDVGQVPGLVESTRCDLGVTFRPVPASLRTLPWGRAEFLLVCPPGTELSGTPVPLDELPGRMIAPAQLDVAEPELRELGWHPSDVPVAVQTDLRELVVPLVLAGVGVTLLPRALAEGAGAQGAVVAPVEPPVALPLSLLHRPDDLSPAAAAFLDRAVG